MSCPSEIDLCVTRGSVFELDVGLATGWDEVAADPTAYRGVLVFREEQDDTLPEIIRLTVAASTDTEEVLGDPPVYLPFKMTGSQTQTLPYENHVAFCEVYDVSFPNDPIRVFNAKVKVGD